MPRATSTGHSRRSDTVSPRRRVWWFRLAAIGFGLLLLLAMEGVLRLVGWAETRHGDDPFVGFHHQQPLFIHDATGQRYAIPLARQEFFRPEAFAATKGAREFRIFVLGGSTVQGRPYAIETSFTTWLELSLQAADPSREWEVVNCGGVSYASYRLAPILQELLGYDPDLFILYTGQNEFLEERTYADVKASPKWLAAVHGVCSRLHLYRLGRHIWVAQQGRAPRATLPAEVDALLDYRGGLEDYHRDDAWREGVMRHFAFNIERMVDLAQEAGVPLILVNPTVNLKDCPPFKFELAPSLSVVARQRFERLWNQAQQTERPQQALVLLKQALELDPHHAGALFLQGKCYQALGRNAEAGQAFVRAKDADVCPLRLLEPMVETLRRVARDNRVPLVDVRSRFQSETSDGIIGDEIMVDHVHPSIEGHQLVADMLFEQLVAEGMVQPQDGWRRRRAARYEEHLASLDAVYFERGKQRLEGLRRWSQGRAYKVRPAPGQRPGEAN